MGFLTYLANRVGVYIVVIVLGISVTFLVPRFMPRDPINQYIGRIESMAGQTLRAEEVQMIRRNLEELYGLKGSLFSQYLRYFGRLARLDFGPGGVSKGPGPHPRYRPAEEPWSPRTTPSTRG